MVKRKLEIPSVVQKWDVLLTEFGELRQVETNREFEADLAETHSIRNVLDGFHATREQYRKVRSSSADDFNILEVLQLARKELHYSKVLAWLLDHDLFGFGTHAQGPLGFQIFLEVLGLPM